MDVIRRQGNLAVHSTRPVQSNDAIRSAAELFHVMYWLACNYARNEANVPPSSLGFDASLIPVPQPAAVRQKKLAELQEMAEQVAAQQEELAKERRRSRDLDDEVQRLRDEIRAAKAANEQRRDTHDYSEAETRVNIIDLLLREAGYTLRKGDAPADKSLVCRGRTSGSICVPGINQCGPAQWRLGRAPPPVLGRSGGGPGLARARAPGLRAAGRRSRP
jgi:hypothetical protein